MRFVLLSIVLAFSSVTYGQRCTKVGLFPLIDGTPEFYGCFRSKNGDLILGYLTCKHGKVFSATKGFCIWGQSMPNLVQASANSISTTKNYSQLLAKDVEGDKPLTERVNGNKTEETDILFNKGKPQIISIQKIMQADSETTKDSSTSEANTTGTVVEPESTEQSTENNTHAESTEDPNRTTENTEETNTTLQPDTTKETEITIEETETTNEEDTTVDSGTTGTTQIDVESTEVSEGTTITMDGDLTTEITEETTVEPQTTTDATIPTTTMITETITTATELPTIPTTEVFDCPAVGFFPKDETCEQFFYCTIMNNKLMHFEMNCPMGQYFNPQFEFCDINYNCDI